MLIRIPTQNRYSFNPSFITRITKTDKNITIHFYTKKRGDFTNIIDLDSKEECDYIYNFIKDIILAIEV